MEQRATIFVEAMIVFVIIGVLAFLIGLIIRAPQRQRAAASGAAQPEQSPRWYEFTLALILLALTLQIASRIGDYLVAVLFVQATHNNLQSLTILIGNAWLASYVVQLLVSLFVTPWILNKLGVFSVGVKIVGAAAGWVKKLIGGAVVDLGAKGMQAAGDTMLAAARAMQRAADTMLGGGKGGAARPMDTAGARVRHNAGRTRWTRLSDQGRWRKQGTPASM